MSLSLNDLSADQGSLGRITVAKAGTPVRLSKRDIWVSSFTLQAEGNEGSLILGTLKMDVSSGEGLIYILQPWEAITIRAKEGRMVNPVNYELDAEGDGSSAILSYEPN